MFLVLIMKGARYSASYWADSHNMIEHRIACCWESHHYIFNHSSVLLIFPQFIFPLLNLFILYYSLDHTLPLISTWPSFIMAWIVWELAVVQAPATKRGNFSSSWSPLLPLRLLLLLPDSRPLSPFFHSLSLSPHRDKLTIGVSSLDFSPRYSAQ